MSADIPVPDDVLACPEESYAATAWVKLRRFAAYLAARFNAPVYLVGSALTKPHPRDVDVTVVISDAQFKARYGQDSHGWAMDGPSQAWIDDIGKMGTFEALQQRINLDLKVYPARHSTQYLGKPRVLLASPTGAIDEAQAVRDADLALADSLATASPASEAAPAEVERVAKIIDEMAAEIAAQPRRGGLLPDGVILRGVWGS